MYKILAKLFRVIRGSFTESVGGKYILSHKKACLEYRDNMGRRRHKIKIQRHKIMLNLNPSVK